MSIYYLASNNQHKLAEFQPIFSKYGLELLSLANVAEYVFGDDMINRWEPYAECPNLMPGCTAFRLNNVPGKEGIVDLTTLTGNNEYLYVTFGDEKGTGFAKARMEYFSGPKTNFAVAILGQHEGKEVMFTFHPGDPIRPSTAPDEKSLWGQTVLCKGRH